MPLAKRAKICREYGGSRKAEGGAMAQAGPTHGFYVLSSGELEYERLKALRESRVRRILEVREQGRTLAKERRQQLGVNTKRFEDETLGFEKENWLRERAEHVDQMKTTYEQLRLNVGEGHKKAKSVTCKAKRRASRLSRHKEKIALATEERYTEAVAEVNRRRREFGARIEDFKDRRARVKEIEGSRAKERVAAYFAGKEQREEALREKEEELLRLLGQGSKSFSTSHLHELGIPVEIRRHDGEAAAEEDANTRAWEINKKLKESEEQSKKVKAKALLREAERTHAAAQFVRAREMGKQVNKKLSNLWLADRQDKINDFMRHQKRRLVAKETSETEKIEREIEDIFNLKPQKGEDEVEYATTEEVQNLKWSRTLPKNERSGLAKSLRSEARPAPAGVQDSAVASDPTTSKPRPPISISVPRRMKKSKKTQQEGGVGRSAAREPQSRSTGEAKPAPAAPRTKRSPKLKGKRQAKASGQDPRLSRKVLKGIEGYLDEKDPLNLQQLADDISLLTSSVLTDATELARQEEELAKQDEQLFSDTTSVMTFDDFLEGAEELLERSAPSTSNNSSDPSFLNLVDSTFPELKTIDDNLLSDSLFSLDESATKGTESKSSKSSPFTLIEDELGEQAGPGPRPEEGLLSPSTSSSSVLGGGGAGKGSKGGESSTLLDTSDDDLIDNFLENFEGSAKSLLGDS